ncbi:unnamed protein product [Dicrocoelium dendriticum]|nr:unnamed protein product [Dicrocoelium dendriticum]
MMDNLDALLNELHQTNEEILKRNQICELPTHTTMLDSRRPLETEIDLVPSPSICSTFTFDQKHSTSSEDYSSKLQPPVQATHKGRAMKELNDMLNMLDQTDYANLIGDDSSLTFTTHIWGDPNENSPKSDSTRIQSPDSNTAFDNDSAIGQSTNSQLFSTEDQSPVRISAAHHASQQLDDLLVSLGQLKLDQQQRYNNNTKLEYAQTNSMTGISVDPEYTSNQFEAVERHPTKLVPKVDGRPAPTEKKPIIDRPEPHSSAKGSRFISEPKNMLSNMLNDLSTEMSQRGAVTTAKGLCFACKKPIVGPLVSALNRDWHPDHFTCLSCGVGLVGADFYERKEEPYCTDCHARLFSPKCARCGDAITDKCIVALGRTWHTEHFFCNDCHQTFGGKSTVHEHGDQVYCPTCYLRRFGMRCTGCNGPIMDSYITALDVPWHRACFACQDCGKQLYGSSYHEVDGYPYCASHYYSRRGLLCVVCGKPITGRCVNALGRRYHPEHFTCAYCLQPLQTGTFKEHSNKPYCHQCFSQLFG